MKQLSPLLIIFSIENKINIRHKHVLLNLSSSVSLCLSVCPAAYCSINDPPMNGGVINRTKLRPGSRLLFYCNRGYRLVGSSNSTCRLLPNGLFQWDTPPPFCQGKDFKHSLHHLSDDEKSIKNFKFEKDISVISCR